jgi:hypothetical protein
MTTETDKKRGQAGVELTFAVFEQAKKYYTLDRVASVINIF